MKTKTIFSVSVMAALAGSALAHADCLSKYDQAMKDAQNRITADIGDGDSDCSRSLVEQDCGWGIVSSLGIPNMAASSTHMSDSSGYAAVAKVYNVLKDAQIGGGINLINFVDDIKKSNPKVLGAVDLDYAAGVIRDADKNGYFCGSTLDSYDEAKVVVTNLLKP